MKNSWQLQDAKAKFSFLVEQAQNGEVQVVTKHGKEAVVLMSVDQYNQIIGRQKDFVSFFRESPLMNSNLDLTRDQSPDRGINL